ncbi:hypothetical protein [Enterococcus faecium]|uniref:hypothetical protein n=1 Tax=Enterococcus faecium TaxID=1352 RepID=UPI001913D14A|nr:hypothetical protein [Enterococcus faecium]MBK5028925.1 hypothetical protein [Enterococcus faecium]MBK5039643.1 hypothetical protein [Enterococcus faecium]MBK5044575.1 hypothetical protein [Enterococcus faecium]MBK5069492.1 hypothetical protein [Enterococcus faecium]MBK5132773.1 hypothetical protein [Enterococcus faecium]
MEHWINWYLNYWILLVILLIVLLGMSIYGFFLKCTNERFKKGYSVVYASILLLVLFGIGCFVLRKTWDKISVYEGKVREVLVDNHYIFPKNVKTNVESNIFIEKIGKDGTIYFSVEMHGDYIKGNMNKDNLKCQIVNEENMFVPNIIKCLSDHHISLYSFDFTGVPTGVLFPLSLHFDIDGLEGITTDNQLVKVECKDNGKTILTINK